MLRGRLWFIEECALGFDHESWFCYVCSFFLKLLYLVYICILGIWYLGQARRIMIG